MKLKGIVFDFNGTLFLDSEIHQNTWFEIANELRDTPLTLEEYQEAGHGKTNDVFISYLLGERPSDEKLNEIIERKEARYRQLCMDNPKDFKLAPGSIEFLNQVKKAGIKRTVATGAYERNVDFYFEHFSLSEWFDRSLVVFDDGLYPGKPEPYPYIRAAEKLGLTPESCIVFEDSMSGIQSATLAGIGRVIAVEPSLDSEKLKALGGVHKITNGFENLDLHELIQG